MSSVHKVDHDQTPNTFSDCENHEANQVINGAISVVALIGGLAAIGLAVAGVGNVHHWWNLGALHDMKQYAALFVGGSGLVLTALGGVGLVSTVRSKKPVSAVQEEKAVTQTQEPPRKMVDMSDAKVAYATWGVMILDEIPQSPPMPAGNDPFFKQPYSENYVWVYIPKRVRFNDEDMDFTLENLSQKIRKGQFYQVDELAKTQDSESKKQLGAGWRLISKRTIPNSADMQHAVKQRMLTESNGRQPFYLEAAVAHQLIHSCTGEDILTSEMLCIPTKSDSATSAAISNSEKGLRLLPSTKSKPCGIGIVIEFPPKAN